MEVELNCKEQHGFQSIKLVLLKTNNAPPSVANLERDLALVSRIRWWKQLRLSRLCLVLYSS